MGTQPQTLKPGIICLNEKGWKWRKRLHLGRDTGMRKRRKTHPVGKREGLSVEGAMELQGGKGAFVSKSRYTKGVRAE
jgi:hypothetical protein